MSLLHIVDGDFGQPIELTYIDVDTEAAANISSYSDTIQMVFTSPTDVETEKTATFKTDGTDGIISYTTETGYLTAGEWTVRGKVISTGTAQLSTVLHTFLVIA